MLTQKYEAPPPYWLRGNRIRNFYYLKITFEDARTHQKYQEVTQISRERYSFFQEGQSIDVVYLPENPSIFKLKNIFWQGNIPN